MRKLFAMIAIPLALLASSSAHASNWRVGPVPMTFGNCTTNQTITWKPNPNDPMSISGPIEVSLYGFMKNDFLMQWTYNTSISTYSSQSTFAALKTFSDYPNVNYTWTATIQWQGFTPGNSSDPPGTMVGGVNLMVYAKGIGFGTPFAIYYVQERVRAHTDGTSRVQDWETNEETQVTYLDDNVLRSAKACY